MERLILACQFASQGKLDQLRTLFASDREYFILGDPFTPHSAWSILLLLVPESINPINYEPLIRDILDNGLENDAKEISNTDETFFINLPESQIQLRVSRLIGELKYLTEQHGWSRSKVELDSTDSTTDSTSDSISKFIPNNIYSYWLKCRLRSIDNCCGKLDWFIPLLRYSPENVQDWYYGIVNVVNQYRNLYANNHSFTLEEFENNPSQKNVNKLLSSTSISHINRDFEKLIVPYISYINQWDDSLNEWISKQVELNNFELLVPISEVNQSSILEKPLLTACYLNPNYDLKSFETIRNIHQGIYTSLRTRKDDEEKVDVYDITSYNFNSLLKSSRTNANKESLHVLLSTLNACEILSSAGLPANMKFIVELQTNGKQEDEEQIVLKYLKNPLKKSWSAIRIELNLLKSNCYLLKHVSDEWIDSRIISGGLKSGDFDFIKKTYRDNKLLIELALEQLYLYYDCGNMKNALNCLTILESDINESFITTEVSNNIKQASALLNATIEISKYESTSFSPLEIKSKSPLEIIDKILSNNQLSYRELTPLIKITEHLVFANNYQLDDSDSISIQIRSRCITYALVNDNFKVAYDYCVPHLTSLKSPLAWTSCYQVGKYISPFWDYPPISILEQQLKILSYTLRICPKENITGVLSTWKKNDALYQELVHENKQKASTSHTYSSLSASRIAKAISSSAAEFTSQSDSTSGRRQHISNLLVNGLGWAIGANQ